MRKNIPLFSHRGVYNNINIIENSIKAFEKSIKNSFAIELDVRITKDKKVVVFHDKNLKRAANIDKNISDLKYEDLKNIYLFDRPSHIPLLKDVLKFIDRKVPIFIEIKRGKNISKKVKNIVKNYSNYAVISKDAKNLTDFKNIKKGFIFGEEKLNIRYLKKILKKIEPDFLVVHKSKIVKIKKLFKNRYPLIIWTLTDKKEIKKYEPFYDGIIFDKELHKVFGKNSNLFIYYKNVIY